MLPVVIIFCWINSKHVAIPRFRKLEEEMNEDTNIKKGGLAKLFATHITLFWMAERQKQMAKLCLGVMFTI